MIQLSLLKGLVFSTEMAENAVKASRTDEATDSKERKFSAHSLKEKKHASHANEG